MNQCRKGFKMVNVRIGYDNIELMTTSTRESLTEMQAQILVCELEDAIEKLQAEQNEV